MNAAAKNRKENHRKMMVKGHLDDWVTQRHTPGRQKSLRYDTWPCFGMGTARVSSTVVL